MDAYCDPIPWYSSLIDGIPQSVKHISRNVTLDPRCPLLSTPKSVAMGGNELTLAAVCSGSKSNIGFPVPEDHGKSRKSLSLELSLRADE